MPSTTFEHSAHADAPPDAVMARLEDATTWSGIGPLDDVRDPITGDAGKLESFRWSARAAGRTWDGTATRALDDGGAFRLALDSSEIGGEIAVAAKPDGDGSLITVTLTARSKGMLAGMFWGVVSDAIGNGLPRQVEEFAAGLTAGSS